MLKANIAQRQLGRYPASQGVSNVMSSMVLEMQKMALNSNESLESLVRYAYAVATKLGKQDTRNWALLELNGYGEIPVPDYRLVSVRLEAFHPVLGHRKPFRYANPESQLTFEKMRLNMPLAELSHLAKCEGTIEMTLAPEVYYHVFRGTDQHKSGMEPVSMLSQNTIVGVLDIVRTKVLDWSLELGTKGVKGEEFEFTSKEKEIASHIVVHGNYTQILTQSSSNIAISTDGSTSSLESPEANR